MPPVSGYPAKARAEELMTEFQIVNQKNLNLLGIMISMGLR